MRVKRGLVIGGHWVSLILAGRKTWEMRSQSTKTRGTIGLIPKGTGQVLGVADLVDCGESLSDDQMLENIERHQIPESMIRSGEIGSWRIPWVLQNAIGFSDPVPYDHPSGAVKWVRLDDGVSDQISERLKNSGRRLGEGAPVPRAHTKPTPTPAQTLSNILAPLPDVMVAPYRAAFPPAVAGIIIGRTVITDGNLKNNHLYLRGFFDKFPADAVGGSNRNLPARALLKVRWYGSQWHETDLDGQKLFFRSRSLIRKFFEETGARLGDAVDVEQLDLYHYVLHLCGAN